MNTETNRRARAQEGNPNLNTFLYFCFSTPYARTDEAKGSYQAAWEKIKQATAEKDLDDVKEAVQEYIKSVNGEVTYRQLEETFID
ncbi:Hexamer-binding protein [Fusarium acuminatum]|uniref:Hexamer-binding protein n=1 Tax=Fusarium acuminatum TaxID=5515 RepID=A0ABZ2WUM4_9HYPO